MNLPRSLLGAGLLLVAATAVADVAPPKVYVVKPRPPEGLELATLQAGKAPLGLAIENTRAVAAKALAAAERHTQNGDREILVFNALSWGGVTAEKTRLSFDMGGKLFHLSTTVSASGAVPVARLMKLDEELCKKYGPINRQVSSPTVTFLSCHGPASSNELWLKESRTVTATTDQITVELSLARVPPG